MIHVCFIMLLYSCKLGILKVFSFKKNFERNNEDKNIYIPRQAIGLLFFNIYFFSLNKVPCKKYII